VSIQITLPTLPEPNNLEGRKIMDKNKRTTPRPDQDLDILDHETWKHPRPDLLIAPELEAFNGWYGVMINPSPKYGEVALSHEEATQLAWKFILDSMKNQHREGRGRYAPKSKEMKNGN
jgi:hypothetical protein